MTPAADLAQLAQDMRAWRETARWAVGADPYAPDVFQGRADAYRAAALRLRRDGPSDALIITWLAAADVMAERAYRHRAAGRPGEAAWCTGYQRAMEDAAELVAEHAEEQP